jgi:hypothetical protein
MSFAIQVAHQAIFDQTQDAVVPVTVLEDGVPRNGLSVRWRRVDEGRYSPLDEYVRRENRDAFLLSAPDFAQAQGDGIYQFTIRRAQNVLWHPGHTLLHVEVRLDQNDLEPEMTADLSICWGRVHLTPNFCIHFTEMTHSTNSQAVIPSPGGSILEVIEQMGEDLEDAYSHYGLTPWGEPGEYSLLKSCHGVGRTYKENPPPNDPNPNGVDVTIEPRICVVCRRMLSNCPPWRLEITPGHLRKSDAVVIMDVGSSGGTTSWISDNSTLAFLRELTAHELFHAVQYRYIGDAYTGNQWWYEGVAEWFVSLVYPGSTQAVIHAVRNGRWGRFPSVPLDYNHSWFVYSRSVFFRYLSEKIAGDDPSGGLLRQAWLDFRSLALSTQHPIALVSLAQTLAALPSGWDLRRIYRNLPLLSVCGDPLYYVSADASVWQYYDAPGVQPTYRGHYWGARTLTRSAGPNVPYPIRIAQPDDSLNRVEQPPALPPINANDPDGTLRDDRAPYHLGMNYVEIGRADGEFDHGVHIDFLGLLPPNEPNPDVVWAVTAIRIWGYDTLDANPIHLEGSPPQPVQAPPGADLMFFKWDGQTEEWGGITYHRARGYVPPGQYHSILLVVTNLTYRQEADGGIGAADNLEYRFRARLVHICEHNEQPMGLLLQGAAQGARSVGNVALRPRDLVRLKMYVCGPPPS